MSHVPWTEEPMLCVPSKQDLSESDSSSKQESREQDSDDRFDKDAASASDDARDVARGPARTRPPQEDVRRSLLPTFPLHTLPSCVAAFVTELADSLEVSPDMPAAFALGALSTSLLGKILVSPKQDWREPPILYMCVVADAGQRKSPTLHQVMAPLYRIESNERTKWKAECAQIDEDNLVLGKGEKPTPMPQLPRLIAGDATPEKLATMLSEAKDARLAMLSDEASVLDMASGMYSSTPNLDVYLKSWDCSTLIVDRKLGPPIYVERPSLTMVQCAQRVVFEKLARKPELRGKGLLPRFLFSVPGSTRGRRVHDRPPVDPQVRAGWGELVTTLFHWAPGTNGHPRVVMFDRLAQEECLGFQRWLEKLIAPGSALDDVGDMADKLVGAMTRIALLLWAADSSPEEREDPRSEISGSTVRRAIEIATYFLRHNEHVLVNLLTVRPGDEAAETLWRWLKSEGRSELVLGRDTQRSLPRSLRASKEKATMAAQRLVDRGLLEPAGAGWIVVGLFADLQ